MYFFTLLTLFKIMDDIQLFKPNEIVSIFAELELNRTARHLFNYFLQHAQRKIKFENFQGDTFHINIKKLNELANINPNTYDIVEKSLRCLMRPVEIRNDPHCYEAFVPVTRVKVNKKTGEYDFTLQRLVIDLLRQTDYFTKLELKEFNLFNSKFSLIILEFLKQYEKLKKIPEVSVDELRKITDTTKKYQNFKHLQQYVLDVAVKEINESTNYSVSYELIKVRTQRRPKVGAIQFYFSKKKNQEENKSIDKNIQEEESKTLYKQVFLDKNSLYYEFIKFAPSLEETVYIRSTYTYRESTLKAFLFSIQKNQYYLNSQTYMQWLEDRTNNQNIYKNYLKMAMPFNQNEIVLKFREASNLVLKREFTQDEINQINDLLSYFDFYEYSVLVKKFETLFNQLVPTNSYNPFSKMIERNA